MFSELVWETLRFRGAVTYVANLSCIVNVCFAFVNTYIAPNLVMSARVQPEVLLL